MDPGLNQEKTGPNELTHGTQDNLWARDQESWTFTPSLPLSPSPNWHLLQKEGLDQMSLSAGSDVTLCIFPGKRNSSGVSPVTALWTTRIL